MTLSLLPQLPLVHLPTHQPGALCPRSCLEQPLESSLTRVNCQCSSHLCNNGRLNQPLADPYQHLVNTNTVIILTAIFHFYSAAGLGGGSSSHAVDSSMQRQQADLQAKILSLLGSSAVVPASKPASSPSAPAGRSGYGSASRYTEDALYGDYSYTDRYRQPSYGGFH